MIDAKIIAKIGDVYRIEVTAPIWVDRVLMGYLNAYGSDYNAVTSSYYRLPEDVISIATKAACEESLGEYDDSIESSFNSYMSSLHTLKSASLEGIITQDEFTRAREVFKGQLPLGCFATRTIDISKAALAEFLAKDIELPEIKLIQEKLR